MRPIAPLPTDRGDILPVGAMATPEPAPEDAEPAPDPPRRGNAVLAEEPPEVVEQRTIQRLRELMRALTRALKAKKMYPANNPVLSRILSEFQDLMMGTLEDLEELKLSVQPSELLYNSNAVYTNPAKRDSLAYRFHRDGITEIAFSGGLTPPELNAFLDVLARATEPRGAEEDLVTLLWEQEFSHIRYAYIAIDDMQESLLEGVEVGEGDEESREVPWPGAGDSSGLTIVVEDVETSGEGSGERSDDWNELVPALDITERCPAHLLVLSPHELQELAEEIHLEHSRPLTETALEILTEVAEEERNADRFADLARAFADLVILALSEADLGHGTQVLATLHTLCAERGVDAAGFLPDAADLVKQAVASIHHFAEADTTSLPELLAHLGPAAIDPVCDLLADVNHATLHPQLAAGLSLMAPRCMARVRERLMAAGNPAAGHILAALAVSPAAETEAALLEALDHHEPRVRRDALQALASRGAVSRPAVKDRMARALQDPDPQVRSAALSLVRVHAGPDMAESLLSIAEDPDFRERSPAERKAFFETLARLPGPRLRRTLREWASRQNWWPDADAAERRSLSAWALARTGEAEDRAFLARHAKSIFPSVRAAARRALAEAPGAAVEKPKRKTDRRAA